MCIGIPLQLVRIDGVHGLACGRGRRETVDLRLVGPCAVGDWLLVFQGAAREWLSAERAAEIHAALDLLEQAQAGDAQADADPGFALPSSMSAAQLAALIGTPTGTPTETTP